MGTTKEGTLALYSRYCLVAQSDLLPLGCGGLWEQIPHQGLDPQSIILKIKSLAQAAAVSH
jgi:hypothetical protein